MSDKLRQSTVDSAHEVGTTHGPARKHFYDLDAQLLGPGNLCSAAAARAMGDLTAVAEKRDLLIQVRTHHKVGTVGHVDGGRWRIDDRANAQDHLGKFRLAEDRQLAKDVRGKIAAVGELEQGATARRGSPHDHPWPPRYRDDRTRALNPYQRFC